VVLVPSVLNIVLLQVQPRPTALLS
jgi:hypothetical protein